jgi:uncharacterized protein YdaT
MILQIIGYVVPLLAGGLFLWLAFRYFAKEKFPTSTMFGLIGGLFLLSALPWFQGLAKTWIVSNVNSKLKALGTQIDDVQKTTADMHQQLSNHQKQIDDHQKELDSVQGKIRKTQSEVRDSQDDITNQYSKLISIQTNVAAAQANLEEQQKKIEDVEFLVRNFFSKTYQEEFAVTDTNRVTIVTYTNGGALVWFRLKHSAVPNSISAVGQMPGGQTALLPPGNNKNMVYCFFHPGADLKTSSFTIRYLPDSRDTNLWEKIEVRGINTFLDGIEMKFRQRPE